MSSTEVDAQESSIDTKPALPVSWNYGVQGSIRTSFGARTSSQLPRPSAFTAINSPTEENGDGELNSASGQIEATGISMGETVGGGWIPINKQSPTTPDPVAQEVVDESNSSNSQIKPSPSSEVPKKNRRTKPPPLRERIAKQVRNEGPESTALSSEMSLIASDAEATRSESDVYRSISPERRIFRRFGKNFDLSPIPDPAAWSAQTISYRRAFLPHFLQSNKGNLQQMDVLGLCKAFRAYVMLYFGNFTPRIRDHILGQLKATNATVHTERALAVARDENQKGLDNSQKHPLVEDKKPGRIAKLPTQRESFQDGETSSGFAPISNERKLNTKVFMMGRLLGINRTHSLSQGVDKLLASKYFPTTSDSTPNIVCLTCMGTDHHASSCPSLTCKTCGSRGLHFSHGCPETQRCVRCRQQGHQILNCPEKLAASASEGQNCDICSASDHLESNCPMIWRSFKPELLTLKMVQYVPIHCYYCGREGHFGPECGLRRRQGYKGSSTWSQTNSSRYIDPQSNLRAISAGVDYTIRGRSQQSQQDFRIKGKARHDPILIDDDSDNANGSFIRPKINAAPPRKQMHIKRQPGNDNYRPPLPESFGEQSVPRRAARPNFNQTYDRNEDRVYHDRARSRSPIPRARPAPARAHRERDQRRGHSKEEIPRKL